MAGTRPAPQADRIHRIELAALALGTLAAFVWLVADLASAAFGA